jgi:hypothetical protein
MIKLLFYNSFIICGGCYCSTVKMVGSESSWSEKTLIWKTYEPKTQQASTANKQENNEEQAQGRQRDERAWLNKITAIFLLNNFLTPEDGQFRPKHVVVWRFYGVRSVGNTTCIRCFKHWQAAQGRNQKSESEGTEWITELKKNWCDHIMWPGCMHVIQI